MLADPVAIACDLIRCPSVTPVEGGALTLIENLLKGAGFEVRGVQALREHYVLTVRRWLDTLETRWDEFVALSGEETARVWRLYLAGGALAFEDGRMGVDQYVAVRP